MTYSSVETSVDDGNPIELYEFVMSPLSWYYTDNPKTITNGLHDYLTTTISRSKISQSEEINRVDLTITVPRDFAPADRFRVTPSSDPMIVNIRRKHVTDAEDILIWQGRVMSVSWEGATANLICEPTYSSMRRPGLRRYYTYICAHSLYGSKCRVVSEVYRVSDDVSSVADTVINVPIAGGQADGFYTGGFVEYLTEEGMTEQKLILSHIGSELTLATTPVDLVGGMLISIFPGCDHTIDTCEGKFSNKDNYGGFPYIPTGSPFAGKIIF